MALDYAAAPGCPQVDEFQALVAGRLGYHAFGEHVPNRVHVRIASRGRAFEGRIEWRDAHGDWLGERTFPSRTNDCRELVRVVAFALAVQIQLSAAESAPAPPAPPAEPDRTAEAMPAAAASAPPVTAPAPSEVTELTPAGPASPTPRPSSLSPQASAPGVTKPAPPPGTTGRPGLAVGAGTSMGFGLSPSGVPSGRVFGSIAWPHFSLELAGEVSWPVTIRRADGAGFVHQELLAGLAACGALAAWSACLLAKGGAIRIAGKDIDRPASSWGAALEAGLRLALRQPLGRRVYLVARAEALVLLTRWRVTLDQYLVWSSPRFAESIGLDVGIRFP